MLTGTVSPTVKFMHNAKHVNRHEGTPISAPKYPRRFQTNRNFDLVPINYLAPFGTQAKLQQAGRIAN